MQSALRSADAGAAERPAAVLKYADGWKKYIITSEPEFEHYFGCRADKKRKLYNGMIKCDYYMYTEQKRTVKNQGGKP